MPLKIESGTITISISLLLSGISENKLKAEATAKHPMWQYFYQQ